MRVIVSKEMMEQVKESSTIQYEERERDIVRIDQLFKPEDGETIKYYLKLVAPDPQLLEALTGIAVEDQTPDMEAPVAPFIRLHQRFMPDPVAERPDKKNGGTKAAYFIVNSPLFIPSEDYQADPILEFLEDNLKEDDGYLGGPTIGKKVAHYRELVKAFNPNFERYNQLNEKAQKSLVARLKKMYPDESPSTLAKWVTKIRTPKNNFYSTLYWMRVIPVAREMEDGTTVPLRSKPVIMEMNNNKFLKELGLFGTSIAPKSLCGRAMAWAESTDTRVLEDGNTVDQESGEPVDLLDNLFIAPGIEKSYDLVLTVTGEKNEYGTVKPTYSLSVRKSGGNAKITALADPKVLDEDEAPSMFEIAINGAKKVERTIDAFRVYWGEMDEAAYEGKYLTEDEDEEEEDDAPSTLSSSDKGEASEGGSESSYDKYVKLYEEAKELGIDKGHEDPAELDEDEDLTEEVTLLSVAIKRAKRKAKKATAEKSKTSTRKGKRLDV